MVETYHHQRVRQTVPDQDPEPRRSRRNRAERQPVPWGRNGAASGVRNAPSAPCPGCRRDHPGARGLFDGGHARHASTRASPFAEHTGKTPIPARQAGTPWPVWHDRTYAFDAAERVAAD